MKKNVLLIMTGLLLVTLLSSCAGTSSNNSMVPSLNSAGQGKVYITPDVAYINIGVHSQDENVTTALSNNTDQANAVSSALQELGVDAKDVQTSSFTINPSQQYGPTGEITGTIYMVDNTVYVTVRDLTKLGELLDAVVTAGANTINGIQFDLLDKSAALTQARQQAIEGAKNQAAEIAAASGVTLGKILSVNVYANNVPQAVMDVKSYANGGIGGSVPVSAGEFVITADANITYEIK